MNYTAALIGTGRIGFSLGFDKKREQPASHTMALLQNKKIDLIAGCDSDEEKLDSWKNFVSKKSHRKDIKTFQTSESLFVSVHPDIVTVAVNENSHLSECINAINSKPKLVILEKPVALDSLEAEKIRLAAQKNNVPVMVNHERRFSADYVAAKEFLSKIGEIQSVKANLFSGLRVYGEKYEASGAYSLLHDGTHLVDIVHFLTDEELKNPIVTGIFKDEQGDVRNFEAHFETKKIPEITVSMSGRSKFFAFEIDVLGTLGRICVGNGYAKYYLREESKLYSGFYSLTNQKIKLPKKTGYFSNMIQNAVDFLDGKSTLKSPLEDAIKDLRVLEEIRALLKDEN